MVYTLKEELLPVPPDPPAGTDFLCVESGRPTQMSFEYYQSFVAKLAASFLIRGIIVWPSSVVESLAPFAPLHGVTKLYVRGRKISNLEGADFPNLEDVTISACPRLQIETIEALPTIRYLTLEGRKCTDMSALKKLSRLESLILHRAKGSDLTSLCDLGVRSLQLANGIVADFDLSVSSSLESIFFQDCRKLTHLSGLSGAIRLLRIDSCQLLDMESIVRCPGIIALDLLGHKKGISTRVLRQFDKLKSLNLVRTPLELSSGLELPPQLKTAYISHVSKSALQELRERNPNCLINE